MEREEERKREREKERKREREKERKREREKERKRRGLNPTPTGSRSEKISLKKCNYLILAEQ